MSKISKHTLATILIQAILLTSFSPRGPYEGLRGLYEGLRAPYEGLSCLAYLFPERLWAFLELSSNNIFSVWDLSERRIIGAGALQGYQTPISKINKHSLATIAIQAVLLTRPLRGSERSLRGFEWSGLFGPWTFQERIFSVPELSRNDIFSVRDFNEHRIIGAGALQGDKPEKQTCASYDS